jgi:streptogramin lyase
VWAGNEGANSVSEFNKSGTAYSGSPFTGGGVSSPQSIAVDAAGDVWVVNNNGSVTEFNNSGAAINGSPISISSGAAGVAIDGAGNVWVTGTNGSISELSNSGALLSGANGYQPPGYVTSPGIAIDGSGDVWLANSNGNSVTELIGAAAPVITPIAAGLPATPTANGTSNLGTRP